MVQQDTEISRLAEEIVSYLDQCPDAADSVEGIANWWIARQRVSVAVKQVQLAVDLLCRRGNVSKSCKPDGTIIYRGSHGRGQNHIDGQDECIN